MKSIKSYCLCGYDEASKIASVVKMKHEQDCFSGYDEDWNRLLYEW